MDFKLLHSGCETYFAPCLPLKVLGSKTYLKSIKIFGDILKNVVDVTICDLLACKHNVANHTLPHTPLFWIQYAQGCDLS